MTKLPLVSIGLQFFNAQRTLAFAIHSILNQTYPNWELLLCDDGSTDNSLRVAQGFDDRRIQLWSDGLNKGRAARVNETISRCHGEYFALMDADDIAYPHRIERQVFFLETHPNIDLVGTWMLVFGKNGLPLGKRTPPTQHEQISRNPLRGIPIAQPTFMGKSEWFLQNSYNEEMRGASVEDQDLLLRTYRHSCFANIDEILLGYREESLDLGKLLHRRWRLAKSQYAFFRTNGQLMSAVAGVGLNLLKACIDCIAIGSRLRYRILRHRARALTLTEIQMWCDVYAQVNSLQSVSNQNRWNL